MPTPMEAKMPINGFTSRDVTIAVSKSFIYIRTSKEKVSSQNPRPFDEVWKSMPKVDYDRITRWYVTGDPDGKIGGGE